MAALALLRHISHQLPFVLCVFIHVHMGVCGAHPFWCLSTCLLMLNTGIEEIVNGFLTTQEVYASQLCCKLNLILYFLCSLAFLSAQNNFV